MWALLLVSEGERATRTGCLEEKAVDGLRSCVGEGARLSEADWRVEVRVAAGLEAMGGCWGWV